MTTLVSMLSAQICVCPCCECVWWTMLPAFSVHVCDAPGPKVVSQELSATLLEEVESVLQRRPIIWDNLYANDYDCRRVFLGPYTGRAPGLMPRLHGLLLNPNCELQANFIPIHTLGSWFRSELGSCAHLDCAGTWPQHCRQLWLWGPSAISELMHPGQGLPIPAHLCSLGEMSHLPGIHSVGISLWEMPALSGMG